VKKLLFLTDKSLSFFELDFFIAQPFLDRHELVRFRGRYLIFWRLVLKLFSKVRVEMLDDQRVKNQVVDINSFLRVLLQHGLDNAPKIFRVEWWNALKWPFFYFKCQSQL